MEFESEAHRACYERVSDFLMQLYGESAAPDAERAFFVIQEGSAVTMVDVLPWGEDGASVLTYSYVVTDVEATQELCRFLLEENSKFRLGAFALEGERAVLFQHGLSHDSLEKAQLRASVDAVRQTADDYDDEVAGRFGGLTARDRFRTPPPAPA